MGNLKSNSNLSIVLIGSGNLAFSLAHSLAKSAHNLIEIYSRNTSNAQDLSSVTGAKCIEKIENISAHADLYIISVPDGSIPEVVKLLPKVNGAVVHTSGSTPLESISTYISTPCGIFYPFQTFSFGRVTQFEGIPICIEATDEDTYNILSSLASSLGALPVEMDTDMRKWLHLSGVFACNFVNHMLAISHMLAQENDLDPSLLKPLILETINKALEGNPIDSQTGPAVRGDTETLKRHFVMLNQIDEEIRDLYIAISASIERLVRQ